jgi:hypothetical protein
VNIPRFPHNHNISVIDAMVRIIFVREKMQTTTKDDIYAETCTSVHVIVGTCTAKKTVGKLKQPRKTCACLMVG